MSSHDLLHITRVTVAPQLAEIIDTALELIDSDASRWEKSDTLEIVFEIFFDNKDDAIHLAEVLQAHLKEVADNLWDVRVTHIENQNWQDAWKTYFHVERVSKHIVIKPSHEDYTPNAEDCLIEMDPGMSFGTGQHATTRGCLVFLDELADTFKQQTPSSRSFLDLGCGSGILSIAASKLGFSPIKALDIDPDSITIATENLSVNGVREQVEIGIGDVSTLQLEHTYTVVAANILAKVLIPNATKIAATVAEHGHLLLAGILTEQYSEVSHLYSQLGFQEIKTMTQDEWTSGCFKRF